MSRKSNPTVNKAGFGSETKYESESENIRAVSHKAFVSKVKFDKPQKDEITEDEVIEKLGISRKSLHKYLKEGKLPYREQRSPVYLGKLLEYESQKANKAERLLGYEKITIRYLFKIDDIIRFAQVEGIKPQNSFVIPLANPVRAYENESDPVYKSKPFEDSSRRPMKVKELIEKYAETKLSDGAWEKHMVSEHKSRLENFLEIVGNIPISQVSREKMRYFRETLRKVPPNRKRSALFKGKTIPEILEMKPEKFFNVTTINTIVGAVASMFGWALNEGYIKNNPAKGLLLKDNRDEVTLKDSFTEEDLKKIFSSPKFRGWKSKKPAYFWAPLIGLYTGMRREEICQLECGDIYKLENSDIWVININKESSNNNAKKLKSNSSNRIIPTHKNLIYIGLLGYMETIKKEGHVRLFPSLKATESTPKYGKQVGKAFATLLKSLDIKGNKSFHSLRHSFDDFFKQKGLINARFKYIFGHANQDLTSKRYGSKYSPEITYEEFIEKLNFNLDLELLRDIREK